MNAPPNATISAPLPPSPASLSRAETAQSGSLDERILQAEQRLVARQENLRRGLTSLGGQVRAALQPRRLVKPALIFAGSLAVLLLWRRRHPQVAAAQGEQTPSHAVQRSAVFAMLAGIPWLTVLNAAWPRLPARWRSRISPGTAASVLSAGLPLAQSLVMRRRQRDDAARRR